LLRQAAVLFGHAGQPLDADRCTRKAEDASWAQPGSASRPITAAAGSAE